MKLFLDEDGHEVVRELWVGDTPVSTAGIGHTELTCALAAAVRDRRFAPKRHAAGEKPARDWDKAL